MILLTCFKKYKKFSFNLSEIIVNEFPNYWEEISIKKIILPVIWKSSGELLLYEVNLMPYKPSIIILTGIHELNNISVERYAYNFQLGLDVHNHYRCNPILLKGKWKLNSNIDFNILISKLTTTNNVKISINPGLYLCNYIYYLSLHYFTKSSLVLFIHFPKSGLQSVCLDFLKLLISILVNL